MSRGRTRRSAASVGTRSSKGDRLRWSLQHKLQMANRSMKRTTWMIVPTRTDGVSAKQKGKRY